MRLEAYLLNEGRGKGINLVAAYDIISEKCMQSVKAFHNDTAKIYRGVENITTPASFVDPKSGEPRKSANIANHYTLLMDNISTWRKFPKRSESIICSTDIRGAQSYGNGKSYAVFPYDGSKIAVAPYYDIWASFDKTIGGLMFFIDVIVRFLRGTSPIVKSDKDWNTLKAAMKKFDKFMTGDEKEEWYTELRVGDIKWMKNYDGNLLKTLTDAFDPKKNDIKLTTTGKPLPKNEREVWTDGKSVLINTVYGNYGSDELMNNLDGMVKG